MHNGFTVTEIKTGKTGTFLRKEKRNLSIEFWVVQWEGDSHESKICSSLLLEGQWNYSPDTKTLLPVEAELCIA
jgi:hypothetical protein